MKITKEDIKKYLPHREPFLLSELIRSYASNGRYGANVEIIEISKPRNRLEIDIEVEHEIANKARLSNVRSRNQN